MQFFGSSDTVDGKARNVLGDLPEDPSPFQILQTVDQKAGEDVDPDEVVQKLRDLDAEVDAKLAAVEGQDVDQKDMREAAGTIAERTDMSQAGAMELVSAVMDSIEEMDPSIFADRFGNVVDEYYRGDADVDQAALEDDTDSTPAAGADEAPDTAGGDPDQKQDTDTMGDNASDTDSDADVDADGGVDQKQEDEQMNPIDLVEEIGGSDARETVENYAESVNKDPQDAAAEWVAENVPGVTVEGYNDGGGSGGGEPDAAAAEGGAPAADAAAGDHDRTADQAKGYDQKMDLEDLNLNERIADAVTSDEVIDAMAGEVAQKMVESDEFADNLVETVDQKGDFVTTEDTVVTAPTGESKTVGEAGAITGGGDE